ncbi:hypothetical protein EDB89DRAFT_1223543 [Lactarius sanguifluus]|nr:hypothetical protein EDB89DRAFT_1223543 [Lactarius sanguifluus]
MLLTTFSEPRHKGTSNFGTDQLVAQKARDAPDGHPWPAGQAGSLYAIANEQVAPELSPLEPFLPTVPRPSSSVPRKRRPPQPQLQWTWTCSLARPTRPAPLFCRIRCNPRPACALLQHSTAASVNGGPAAAERGAHLRRAWGRLGGAACRGEGGRGHGGDE